MKLKSVEIENYRAIERMELLLDPQLTVLYGSNAHGKTSVLNAIAVGLGAVPLLLPDVSGISFLKHDRQEGSKFTRVSLTTTDETKNIKWERTSGATKKRMWSSKNYVGWEAPRYPLRDLKHWLEKNAMAAWGAPVDLPIMVFYDTERAVRHMAKKRGRPKNVESRYSALAGALSARTSFKELFEWFYLKENEELREQRERRNHEFRLKELSTVRNAISSMIEGVTEPHVEIRPLRFVVNEKIKGGFSAKRTLEQLSGGYKAVLALAADLAWRMSQGNPHRKDPLNSKAVVLIDEIELHLHPSWQQSILGDLMRTFPNAQFIVSTHSPQIITTVSPERTIELHRENNRIEARRGSAATYGETSGNVLSTVMGVDERPRDIDFVKYLDQYNNLISRDLGESTKAVSLRNKLERLSPKNSGLDRADIEIVRRKLLKKTRK